MSRAQSRARILGLTLLEIAVVAFLFALLSSIIFLSLGGNKAAETKQSEQSELLRKMVVAESRLRDELQDTRLLSPNSREPTANAIEYQKIARRYEGPAVVDVLGKPRYFGTWSLSKSDDGLLIVLTPDGKVKRLADLGTEGRFEVIRKPRSLELNILVGNTPDKVVTKSLEVFMPQEVILGEIPAAPSSGGSGHGD